MRKIVDGNTACSQMAYLFSEMASIYPITPSSPMASNVDNLNSEGALNLFNDKVKVVEMQSEAGAAGALHGALLAGSLATTFTASQGLLLMIPNMYKIAGEGLPGVIHVASRTVATHALSIFGDHSDIYATRQTGFCILASSSVTDAYNLAAVAHLSAIKGHIPFLHFFDGFRTSHEINVIETIDREKLLNLIDYEELEKFKNNALNVGAHVQYGMALNEDIYFQSVEARNPYYEKMPDIVFDYMQKINDLTGENYKPFNYYGDPEALNVIVAMGSVCDTIKLVVDDLNKHNRKVGLITVHLYRPFSSKYLLNVLPKTVQKIAVLDRTKEAGSNGEPLYLDILSALKNTNITVVGGRYGLSSKNTTPSQIKSVFDALDNNLKNDFTIGIKDDVTNKSLEESPYNIMLNARELKIYGFGSDGMVSASKDILKIIGANNSYVEGYFEYDSKKSGGVTISHLRISDEIIKAPYYVTNTDIIVVTKLVYFQKYHLLDSAKENSLVLINMSDDEDLSKIINQHDLKIIKERNLKILTIDAFSLALKHNLKDKISKIMEIIILNILGIKDSMEILSKRIEDSYRVKGEDVVTNNQNAIKEAINKVKKYELSNPIGTIIEANDLFSLINHRMANEVPVSYFKEVCHGAFPNGLSKLEKRGISKYAPKWIKENCIACGMCSFVCPHAVIRPFLVKDGNGIPDIKDKNYNFYIGVSSKDCTSCGLCIDICPGKNGVKALELTDNIEEDNLTMKYFNNYENPSIYPKYSIKGSQLLKPRFEFSGACAGCGETSYIKLLTELFQDEIVIANATGCSSIYGGSAPTTPYSIPWANSLFEDNAEFAYGIHLSYQVKRERIKKILNTYVQNKNDKNYPIYQNILDNFEDFNKTQELIKELAMRDISEELRSLLSYIPRRTVWAIGGDGWAYDIGFGGLDHVLSSNENIKVLVLDTEVYSNTGGQTSKSSRYGQVAEFADLGKRSPKKDLFRIAMSYPNCYVASISLGADMMQTLKSFKEASEHNGPSLIIAYAPCIEHGIKGGLSCTTKEQKLAVNVGYTLLMRYNPDEKTLTMDSKEPDFNRYHEFLDNEIRYNSLKIKNKDLALILLEQNKQNAIERYNYYQTIANNK